MTGAEVAARARACVGARFRIQGRDPALGLDCVGLAGVAFDVAGLPADYALRGGDVARVRALVAAAGLVPIYPVSSHFGPSSSPVHPERSRGALIERSRDRGGDEPSATLGRRASTSLGMDGSGEEERSTAPEGTLLLLRAGPAQLHLAIGTSAGFIHADARARRVVEVPGAPCWPVIGVWRAPETQGGEE